jgi:hypothetical protein
VCGYNNFDTGLQTIRIAASARAGASRFCSDVADRKNFVKFAHTGKNLISEARNHSDSRKSFQQWAAMEFEAIGHGNAAR